MTVSTLALFCHLTFIPNHRLSIHVSKVQEFQKFSFSELLYTCIDLQVKNKAKEVTGTKGLPNNYSTEIALTSKIKLKKLQVLKGSLTITALRLP